MSRPAGRRRSGGPRSATQRRKHSSLLGLVLRCVVVGYVLAAGAVWPRWLSVVSGMLAGCDRCAAAEPPADPRDALIRERRSGSPRWRRWSLTCGSGWKPQSGRGRGTAGTRRCRRRRMTCPGGRCPGSSAARRSGRRRKRAGGSSRAAWARRCGGRSRTGLRTTTRRGNARAAGIWRTPLTWGVARSYQQEEIPAAPTERVQYDLHKAKCACRRAHVADRPAGVPDSVLSIGPRLRALAVYLVVFQHVPVERCRDLISYIDIARKHGRNAFAVLCDLMTGNPWRSTRPPSATSPGEPE